MTPRILTLDNSLTVTGWCVDGWPDTYRLPKPRDRSEAELTGRLLAYESWLMSRVSDHRPHVAVVEGYSYASPNRAHQMGELGWACRRVLWQMDVLWAVVTPGQRAKYATGKGNAPKNAVLLAAARRLGYTGDSDDAADALWLWAMAADHYTDGQQRIELSPPEGASLQVDLASIMPKAHREVLAKIEWPLLQDWSP